jgi:hypothetical protein
MKLEKLRKYLTVLLMVAGLATLNTGCFKMAVPQERVLPVMLWPLPPEIPRISFVNALSRPEDLNIANGPVKRFLRYLAGRAETPLANPSWAGGGPRGQAFCGGSFPEKSPRV